VRGILIDTPAGEIPVEKIERGGVVWSLDETGKRVAVPVLETGYTPISSTIKVVRLTLSDGRSVTASPGHPSAEGRALGSYKAGDILDGAAVVTTETIDYNGGATFDILPAGAAGVYWANGVLLQSTFLRK
jgi:hypothetical protein